MATTQTTMDFLLDQLAGLGQASARKMFGEYCLYLAEKPVGVVCDNQLFLKPTAAGRGLLAKFVEAPPYAGAKPHLHVSADQWEEKEWLCQLVQATANELPQPKPKKPKQKAV
jgi:DNA transformation protein